MAAVTYLVPGHAHPNPPLPAEDLADRMGVGTAEVLGWVHDGLVAHEGLIDPFMAANWLSDGRLDRCPALERRWKNYLRWFMPHVHGTDAPQRYRVRQEHRLHVPRPLQGLTWYVPRITTTTDQPQARLLRDPAVASAEPVEIANAGPFWRLSWPQVSGDPISLSTDWEVLVNPHPVDVFPERAELVDMVEALVADFHYQYRHHQPGDDLVRTPTTGGTGMAGSCLDCALELGRRLSERGRVWRLCTGVVASSAISNPHFWLKVDTSQGWVPVDPSLPAIARMLGADWHAFVAAYVGGCDARRITIAETDMPVPGVPGGSSLGSRLGEVIAVVEGERVNAWACLDWVCGDCHWSFH